MSQWDLIKEPIFHPDCIATEEGWVDAQTGEILVAISNLATKRRNYLDQLQDHNLLLEDGGLLMIEQDMGDSQPDFLLWEA